MHAPSSPVDSAAERKAFLCPKIQDAQRFLGGLVFIIMHALYRGENNDGTMA
jgi:hypothetical protein